MDRRRVLQDDANSYMSNWFHLPQIVLLGFFYIRALFRLFLVPEYNSTFANNGEILYENHLGNYATLKQSPATWMVVSHMLMAIIWVFGTLTQKLLVWGMAKPDRRARYYSRIHSILGTTMCAIAVFGCIIGSVISYFDHKHLPMKWFFLTLPFTFVPAIIMTWISARNRNFINHRFWATTAFIGPCISGLWAEELIYRFGRQTSIGPWKGELLGTGIAITINLCGVALPAWFVRQRQLTSNKQRETSERNQELKSSKFVDGPATIPEGIKSE